MSISLYFKYRTGYSAVYIFMYIFMHFISLNWLEICFISSFYNAFPAFVDNDYNELLTLYRSHVCSTSTE